MIDVCGVLLLLWLVSADGRVLQWVSGGFNFVQWASMCVLADLEYCNSSGWQGRNVVVYSRRDAVARPSISPTDLPNTRLRHVRRLGGQQLWQQLSVPERTVIHSRSLDSFWLELASTA
jgi:hypothetical protein